MIGILPPVETGAAAKGAEAALRSWPALLLLDTVFLYVWYAALLRLAGRPERTLQTVTAVFGFRIILAVPLFLSQLAVGAVRARLDLGGAGRRSSALWCSRGRSQRTRAS